MMISPSAFRAGGAAGAVAITNLLAEVGRPRRRAAAVMTSSPSVVRSGRNGDTGEDADAAAFVINLLAGMLIPPPGRRREMTVVSG